VKSFLERFKTSLIVLVASSVYYALRWTWTLEEEPLPDEVALRLDSGLPVVFAHWHEDEWALLGFYLKRQLIVMVSLRKDGSLMAKFLSKLGYRVARGSSSRNAVGGFLNLIKVVNEAPRKFVCLAVDGPRGPRRRSKKGIFKLAESLNAPIYVGSAAASRAWVFRKSWSKAFIPKPFSKVRLCYVPVLTAEKIKLGVRRDDFATLGYELEESLKSAKLMAQKDLT